MAFSHMTVAAAQGHHDRYAQVQKSHIDTTNEERLRTRTRIARAVEGVEVTIELANLCDRVRAAHRQVRFAVPNRPTTVWRDGMSTASEVWLYFPGDQYCTMRIGFADYAVGGTNANKYAVYSRHVKNDKFGDGRDQYHMVMSDSLERTVKNVNKYMRPYAPSEVAGMHLDNFQSMLSSPMWAASTESSDAKRRVTDHAAFLSELRGLVNLGYKFIDASFDAAIRDYVTKMDIAIEKNNAAHHGYFVQVREYLGAQVFDVIVVLDVKKARTNNVGPHQTCNAEELSTLDAELPGKLATLSMLNNNAFVEGLGTKVNDTCYWVLK